VHINEFDHITSNWDDYLEAECRRGLVYGEKLDHVVDYSRDEPFFYNIRRFVFDNKLVEYAVDAGAELMDNNATVKFTHEKGGVTTTLRDGTELKSRVLIGAAGTFDRVAAHIREREGFPMWDGKDMCTAMYAEIEVGEEFMDRVYGEERVSMAHMKYQGLPGYGWSFAKRNVINVGIGSDRASIKRHNMDLRQYFSDYVKTLKQQGWYPKDLDIPRPNGSNIPVGKGIKMSVGDNLLVVGDAGGFVSPLTGEGLYYAMDSGRLAAQSLEPLLTADTLAKEHLLAYHNAWKSKWGRDLWWLKVAWSILMFMPNRLVNYAAWDETTKELFTHLFVGAIPAAKNMHRIIGRIAKGVVVNDLLRIRPKGWKEERARAAEPAGQ